MHAAAILVAAGASRRMGQDKLLVPLAGKPLLWHTLAAFERADTVESITLVVARERADAVRDLLAKARFSKVTRTTLGGARRQDSVRAGLDTAEPRDWVVVHDGARPLVTPQIIAAVLAAAEHTGAATAAAPVSDTLKLAGEGDTVLRTVPREGLWAVQTPQAFRYELLVRAYDTVQEDVTDDCAMVERLGVAVRLCAAPQWNVKVTTPGDIELADALLRRRAVRVVR